MVLRGFTTIWSLATLPTRRSPLSLIATTLGRINDPLSLGTTRATLLRTYATQVFVVPRSIPSRMGLSAAMQLLECYGAAPLGSNKCSGCTHRSRQCPSFALLSQQRGFRRELDRPFLVGSRRVRKLVEEPARPQEQPRLIALLLHHRIREVQLVLGAGHGHVEQPPLLLLAVRGAQGGRAREPSVRQPDQEHGAPFEAFGLVDGGERELLVRFSALDYVFRLQRVEQGQVGQQLLQRLRLQRVVGQLQDVVLARLGVGVPLLQRFS